MKAHQPQGRFVSCSWWVGQRQVHSDGAVNGLFQAPWTFPHSCPMGQMLPVGWQGSRGKEEVQGRDGLGPVCHSETDSMGICT